MIDLHGDSDSSADLDLNRDATAPVVPVTRRTPPAVWIAAAVVIVAAVVAWFIVRGSRSGSEAPVTASTSQPAAQPEPLPELGTTPTDVNVPPLGESDPVVRELVRQLSSHPTVAAWLATDGLIRNFTVSLTNVADGATPARHLRPLRPEGSFAVATQGEQLVVDPASYDRYDSLAAAVASIDPQGAARLYATLKPRIEEAARELGRADTPIDQTVEQSLVLLLRTPIPNGPIVVQPASRGIGYIYADPSLEALRPAQKQLLRMGPENARSVQRSLRAIALALGIPESRLPRPTTT
jgi:hypothetical protein